MQSSAWAEITSLESLHGGAGWEVGKCLWSPSQSKDGADRYAVMRRPQLGDAVYHLVSGVSSEAPRKRFLLGVSEVSRTVATVEQEPPSPGNWKGARSYYRIELKNYQPGRNQPLMEDVEAGLADQILSDLIARPTYYPYAPYGGGFRVAQGIYLSLLTSPLKTAFDGLLEVEPSGGEEASEEVASTFSEGQRSFREAWFFKRNPALRREALRRHGLTCFACKFNFGAAYGPLGEGYIEMHHLNPLAERLDAISGKQVLTSADDVIPLCANCHRIVHRRRPALDLAALIEALSSR